MKILDRYVATTFIKNYLISFMVLVGLYVVLDMVLHFDEFAEVSDKSGLTASENLFSVIYGVVDFYFFQIFVFFVHLSGMIPVVAAAFTLNRLIRFNEMSAFLSAGVPLLRIAAPIIFVSLVLNALLIVDRELIIPNIIPQILRKHDQIGSQGHKSYPISSMQDSANRLLIAARYSPGEPATMEYVSIVERNEGSQPVASITADKAEWDRATQSWRLTNGRRTSGLLPNSPREVTAIADFKSSITPEEIALYRSGDYVELLSTERINQLLQRPLSYGTTDLQRVKHTRFTQPVINFILVLLGISCGLMRDATQRKTAAMRCFAVTALCITVTFVFQQLAGSPPPGDQWANTWPALMAWIPIFIFGPLAVWLLDRVKS